MYTGSGKGKTTPAIGLAFRIENIDIEQYGLDCFIVNEPEEKDSKAAPRGLKEVRLAVY
ncbi:hypothetical protein DFR78_11160 [Halanaerobium sp. MA284_MarDTE_T2]|nr:hypothetical protein DFR78_11160 [Halanaerobium sp. MA284_MarDTE_T2]